MLKHLLLFLLVLLSLAPVAAQQTPDYSIRNIRTPLSEDQITLQFEVLNSGAPSDDITSADVMIADTGQVVASQPVQPLDENEQVTITINISPATPGLTPGDRVVLLIEVGIGDIEAEDSTTIGDNSATPTIRVPVVEGAQPTPEPTGDSAPVSPTPALPFTLPFEIDLTNPLHVAILIGAGGILLILIWMLTVILRLLFARPPIFTTWQPPYVFAPMVNPESTLGRRQLWQQHAQSDAISMACSPGSFTARKVLIGMNGEKLAGWRVSAVRMSQYDMYGRVARSQTIAVGSVVKRLNGAIKRSKKRTPAKLEAAVRPAAKRLLKDFHKRAKRTPALPIALDVRLKGIHGEVRIIFELYQCVDQQWQMVDQWEPEMTVLSGSITENFTYSLYGQRPGETPRQFRQRLQTDLAQMLTAMIQQPIPARPAEMGGDTSPVKPVSQDTVSGAR